MDVALRSAPSPFGQALLDGLTSTPKRVEPKWFYDEAGSRLFDEICELPEYYVTRTETAILREAASEIAGHLGAGVTLFEPGAGSTVKVRLLLDQLKPPVTYVPADISAAHLEASAAELTEAYPDLDVRPFACDFTRAFSLPADLPAHPVTVFFPGSTIGNFEPKQAERLLARFAGLPRATALLIGVDLRKDVGRLIRAYDDSAGVTAAFNRNLLVRANRELGADFDVEAFHHLACYDAKTHRIEMHLESVEDQVVRVAGHAIRFRRGETIHTENSYKFDADGFAELAGRAGWRRRTALWRDPERLFAVMLFFRA